MRLMQKIKYILFSLVFLSISSFANFAIHPLTPSVQQQMVADGLWEKSCPVPLTRLRDVTVSYYDFTGKAHHDGHLIVLAAVAPDVEAIFKQLYQQHFPLRLVQPTSVYLGDDDASMAADNTSSFNCRPITGNKAGLPSIHAYGLAIDIDPVENPYISFAADGSGKAQVLPAAGTRYINRGLVKQANAADLVKLFKQHGFTIWGGEWHTPIDYQHFQTSRFMAQMLASLPLQDARRLFDIAKTEPQAISKLTVNDVAPFIKIYRKNPQCFLHVWSGFLKKLRVDKLESAIVSLSGSC